MASKSMSIYICDVCIFLSMAVAMQCTKSAHAIAVKYPSLRPYWLQDNNLNFHMYLLSRISNIFSSILGNLDKILIG